MRAMMGAMVLSVLAVSSAMAQTATPPPPPPAPGSAATFKPATDIDAALKKAAANAAGMLSSPITSNEQYRVALIRRDKPAGALAHPGNTELLYITDGSGTMVTGGTLVRAADGKPASIANGVSQKFTKGDVIIVPVGSPHWFAAIDTPVTYLEVRWVAPK
jgi:mannose-6-phosphate isomerase-like protein (cupin superfamily)